MASIIESLTQALSPDLMGQIGKSTGLDVSQIGKGLGVVGPLITSALASRASTPDGLSGLMNSLSQAGGGASSSNLSDVISGGGATSSMLSGLLGPGISAISGTLERALGFKVGPLIAMAAPLVINQLRQRMTAQNLDKDGVAKLLSDEHSSFANKSDAAAGLVRQALDAGKDAAATKAKYRPEQWNDVRLGAAAVALRVMGASPSGLMGSTKEVIALGEALSASKKNAAPTSMLNLAFETALGKDDYNTLPQDGPGLVNVARRAMQAVAANSPSDAVDYGRLLVDAATKVAEASKEGGFLGFGGTRVSEDEQRAIDEIRTAVGSVVQLA